MAEFGQNLVHADSAFQKVFGEAGIANDEQYYDPIRGIDKRAEISKQLLQKASIDTSTGGAGTAGFALIPVFVDPQVIDTARKLTPLVELIPRRAVRGTTFDFNTLDTRGGANYLGQDASLTDDVSTYNRGSVAIKFLYAVGRVTGPSIAGMMGFNDALALDLQDKIQSIKEAEENEIINGNTSTNANGFQGLIQSITTNSTPVSAVIQLSDIRTLEADIFNNRGVATLGVTDASTHNTIKGLLMDFQRQPAQPAEGLPFGIPGAFQFDGINFIRSQFMPTTTTSRRLLLLDMRFIFMAVLQDMTFEELAKTNDSTKYMLKVYEALVVTFEGAQGQLTSLT